VTRANWYVIGIFAVLAGAAFGDNLRTFADLSQQALTTPPPEPINVNQLLLRPFLLRVAMAAVLVLPLVTARAFTGIRADGAPAGRIALHAFVSALATYAGMLAVSMVMVGTTFVFGSPAIGPVVSGYLGLLLYGSAFVAAGLLISSLATSAIAAGCATYAVSFALCATAWLARAGNPGAQPVFQAISAGEPLDDFAKGVIDTAPVLTCAAIMAAALFLAIRRLDAERSAH
jgi:ABC-2 type transport system permease protein